MEGPTMSFSDNVFKELDGTVRGALQFTMAEARKPDFDPVWHTLLVMQGILSIAREKPGVATNALHSIERALAKANGMTPEQIEVVIREAVHQTYGD